MTEDSVQEMYNNYSELPLASYNCAKYLLNNNDLLWKLLYYSDPNAYKNDSAHPVLSGSSKGALIYNGDPDETKYRVFFDVGQDDAWMGANCVLRIAPYNIDPTNHIYGQVSMLFQCYAAYKINTLSNYNIRTLKVIQQVLETLNGADVGAGIGRLYFDARASRYCNMKIGGQINFKSYNLVMCNWIA